MEDNKKLQTSPVYATPGVISPRSQPSKSQVYDSTCQVYDTTCQVYDSPDQEYDTTCPEYDSTCPEKNAVYDSTCPAKNLVHDMTNPNSRKVYDMTGPGVPPVPSLAHTICGQDARIETPISKGGKPGALRYFKSTILYCLKWCVFQFSPVIIYF